MKINIKIFHIREGDDVDIKKRPPIVDPVYKSMQQYQKLLDDHVTRLSAMQQLLYASDRHAVLLIFQGMDAAGKDGAIKHAMSGVTRKMPYPETSAKRHKELLWIRQQLAT
jgi:polyphosphate kinase 2 (PPK2 family)